MTHPAAAIDVAPGPYPHATAALSGDRWTLTVTRGPDDTTTSLLPQGWHEALADSMATALTRQLQAPPP